MHVLFYETWIERFLISPDRKPLSRAAPQWTSQCLHQSFFRLRVRFIVCSIKPATPSCWYHLNIFEQCWWLIPNNSDKFFKWRTPQQATGYQKQNIRMLRLKRRGIKPPLGDSTNSSLKVLWRVCHLHHGWCHQYICTILPEGCVWWEGDVLLCWRWCDKEDLCRYRTFVFTSLLRSDGGWGR